METKALMIGDWMQHASGKYYQVTRTDGLKDGSIHFACGTPHLWEYNNKFYPIPLTDEILKNNGFVDWSDHSRTTRSCSMLLDKNTSICVQVTDGNDSIFLQIHRCGAGSFEHRMNIKYVHQLQQLFRLCGIDKEITLA